MTDLAETKPSKQQEDELYSGLLTALRLRSEAQAEIDAYETLITPLKQRIAELENLVFMTMSALGKDSVPTPYGTPYKSKLVRFNVEDWDRFVEFVKENNAWEYINKAVTKAPAQSYLDANGQPPPGIVVTNVVNLNIRKPREKKAEDTSEGAK